MGSQVQQLWSWFSSTSGTMLWHPPAVHRECDTKFFRGRVGCIAFRSCSVQAAMASVCRGSKGQAASTHMTGKTCILHL